MQMLAVCNWLPPGKWSLYVMAVADQTAGILARADHAYGTGSFDTQHH